jgi:hypothetical protein
MVRRIISQAKTTARNPLLGTEAGRLRLNGVITSKELEAANAFATAVGMHDRLKGYPSRTTVSPLYERGYGSAGDLDKEDEMILRDLRAGGVAEAADRSPRLRRILKATRRFDCLEMAVTAAGRAAYRAVYDVVILDEPIPVGRHADLVAGLRAVHRALGSGEVIVTNNGI